VNNKKDENKAMLMILPGLQKLVAINMENVHGQSGITK
jgi:hypothetical protein